MPDPVDVGTWPPPSWLSLEDFAAVPQDPNAVAMAPLQPGLGVPAAAVDAAVAGATPTGLVTPDQAQDSAQATHDMFTPGVIPTPPAWAPEWGAAPIAPPIADAVSGAGPTFTPGQADPMPLELAPPNPVVDAYDQPKAPPLAADETANPFAQPGEPRERGVLGDTYDYLDPEHPTGGPLAQQERADLASMSDEDLMARKIEDDQRRQRIFAQRAEEASLRNLEQQRANYAASEEANRRTSKQLDELANASDRLTMQDPRKTMSTWDRISYAIAAVLGGLAAPSMGGRNVGIEMFNKAIDDDIKIQQQNLANARDGIAARRGALQDEYRQHGNQLLAAESLRAASWNHVVRALETEQQNYDPRGTTAMQIEITKRQALAAQQEAIRKFTIEAYKQHLEAVKVEQEATKIAEQQRHQRVAEKIDQQNANTSSYNAQTTRTQGAQRIALDWLKMPAEVEKMSAEAADLRAKGKKDEAERLGKFGIPGVTNPDGSTFEATSGNETGLENLRNQIAITNHLVKQVDRLKTIRTGWSSKTANGEENQQVRQLAEGIDFDIVRLQNLGVISAEDAPRIRGYRGFDDPDQFKSFRAGVDEFRNSVIGLTSEQLKAHGYKRDWTLKDYTKIKAAPVDENSPEGMAAFADEATKIANDPKAPGREAAQQWLNLYAAGALDDKPVTNPDYGKTPEEAQKHAAELVNQHELETAAGGPVTNPYEHGGAVDAAAREEVR